MNYVGIDIHKRYSVLVAVDERGRELARGRINGNTAFGFAQFFAGLGGHEQSGVGSVLELGPHLRSAERD